MLLKGISLEPPNGSHERRALAPALPEKPSAFAGVFRCVYGMAEKLSMLLSNNMILPSALKPAVITLVLYNQIPFISTAKSNLVRYVSNKMRFSYPCRSFHVLKNIFMFFLGFFAVFQLFFCLTMFSTASLVSPQKTFFAKL